MRVGEVMTRTVRTVEQHESIDHAAGVFHFWDFRHLPVVDARDHVVGMITPADLLEAARTGGDLDDEPITTVMSAPVTTAREDEPLDAVIERMLEADVHALPVLGDGDRLVGIVTDQDLLSAITGKARTPEAPHQIVVDEVMTRDPATVEPDDTLGDAAELILQGGFRHVPVVDGAGRLLGLLSERDLRTKLGADVSDFPDAALDALSEAVSESMTPDPITVEIGTPLSEVVEAFAAERVGAIPVVDDEKLVGIISYLDVLKWLRDGKPLQA